MVFSCVRVYIYVYVCVWTCNYWHVNADITAEWWGKPYLRDGNDNGLSVLVCVCVCVSPSPQSTFIFLLLVYPAKTMTLCRTTPPYLLSRGSGDPWLRKIIGSHNTGGQRQKCHGSRSSSRHKGAASHNLEQTNPYPAMNLNIFWWFILITITRRKWQILTTLQLFFL